MIAYYGTYDGRAGRAPYLGHPYAPHLAQAPTQTMEQRLTPAEAAKVAVAPEAAPSAAPSATPTVSIGGVRVSIWNIAIAGGVIVGAAAVISASVGAMSRRRA